MMCSAFIQPHAGPHAVFWVWSRTSPPFSLKRNTRTGEKSPPPGYAGHWSVYLFVWLRWVDMAHSQFHTAPALFVCTSAPCKCFLPGRDERLPPKVSLPYIAKKQDKKKRKENSWLQLSYKFKKILHVGAQQSAIYNPHHSGLALKSDRNAGCRQIWQDCQFLQKDKSTEDCHNSPCPISKRLSYLGTPVLMMYNMEDD